MILRFRTVSSLIALASASAALGGAPFEPTSVVTRTMMPAQSGWSCGGEHRTLLDPAGQLVAQSKDDQLAQYLRAHFAGRDLTTVSIGSARGAGFDVQFNLDPDVAADAAFVAALELAAGVWEAEISDNVTIIINMGFVSGVGFIGAASSNRFDIPYSDFRADAIADAGLAETPLVAALPNPDIDIETGGGLISSSDGFFDGIEVTTANARALGIAVDMSDPDFADASIIFNTDFDFDNDPSDGLTPGFIDTVYVMVHEIGHMLGFISSVDGFGGGVFITALDTYRVGFDGVANDPANLADFSSVAREGRRGVEAAVDHVNAVVGAPKGVVYRFSTGTSGGGDGRQASHWKDDVLLNIVPNIGVMDPTTSAPNGSGTGANPGYLTYADLLAFSLIGWDINLDPAPCAGDLNADNSVDSADLAILLAAWGTAGLADLDGSGSVTSGDLAILLATWGSCL